MSSGAYSRWAKRFLDVCAVGVGLPMLAPVLIVAAAAVRLSLGPPVLFVQVRPGKGGQLFRLFKFRTMTDARGLNGEPLSDSERLTRFGAFLRRSSLDELPELLNVLRGEMSLVGPRPLLAEYLPLYTQEQARRHLVRPGITGWAQVNGRNAVAWERKFEHDVWYVDHQGLWLDLKILGLTAWKVLRGDGINQPGQATAEVFRGSRRE